MIRPLVSFVVGFLLVFVPGQLVLRGRHRRDRAASLAKLNAFLKSLDSDY